MLVLINRGPPSPSWRGTWTFPQNVGASEQEQVLQGTSGPTSVGPISDQQANANRNVDWSETGISPFHPVLPFHPVGKESKELKMEISMGGGADYIWVLIHAGLWRLVLTPARPRTFGLATVAR